jgi:predicted dehydrogenase
MQTLNAAVVGVGHLGTFHAQKYQALANEGVNLVALVDPMIESNTKAAELFPGVKKFKSLAELFAAQDKKEVPQLDLASIATVTSEHTKIGVALIERKVAVLVEKPIALNSQDGLTLVLAGERAGVLTAVGQVERFRASEIFPLLGKGPRFIECHRLSPFPQRSTDIDVVLDLMIHDIDLMLAMVPSPLVSVQGAGLPVITPYLDIANARFEFENGCVANLTASRISIQRTRKFRIFAADRYLSLDLGSGGYEQFERDPTKENILESIGHQSGQLGVTDALLAEIKDFVAAVRNKKSPLVSGRDGLRALEVAEQVKNDIERRNNRT